MNFGLSPGFETYLEAVARGEQIIYHSGLDALYLFEVPIDPPYMREPYPTAIAALFDPFTSKTDCDHVIGFCFHQLRGFFKHGGKPLLPYLSATHLETRAFIHCFEADLINWSGWKIEQNARFMDKRPGADPKDAQVELDNYLKKNQEILACMWNALKKGSIPSHIPSSLLQQALSP